MFPILNRVNLNKLLSHRGELQVSYTLNKRHMKQIEETLQLLQQGFHVPGQNASNMTPEAYYQLYERQKAQEFWNKKAIDKIEKYLVGTLRQEYVELALHKIKMFEQSGGELSQELAQYREHLETILRSEGEDRVRIGRLPLPSETKQVDEQLLRPELSLTPPNRTDNLLCLPRLQTLARTNGTISYQN